MRKRKMIEPRNIVNEEADPVIYGASSSNGRDNPIIGKASDHCNFRGLRVWRAGIGTLWNRRDPAFSGNGTRGKLLKRGSQWDGMQEVRGFHISKEVG
jgi:hypothetical protein